MFKIKGIEISLEEFLQLKKDFAQKRLQDG